MIIFLILQIYLRKICDCFALCSVCFVWYWLGCFCFVVCWMIEVCGVSYPFILSNLFFWLLHLLLQIVILLHHLPVFRLPRMRFEVAIADCETEEEHNDHQP